MGKPAKPMGFGGRWRPQQGEPLEHAPQGVDDRLEHMVAMLKRLAAVISNQARYQPRGGTRWP